MIWNKAGMIRGDAHLHAEIDLIRVDEYSRPEIVSTTPSNPQALRMNVPAQALESGLPPVM
ncbi:MAG: hypothetical protein ACRDQH_10110 [Pseudonocardiaceae bacterium]